MPEDTSNERTSADAERMAARALRRASASGAPGKRSRSKSGEPPKRRRSSSSRDPQEVGSVLEGFLAEQGWEATSAIAQISASWAQIVWSGGGRARAGGVGGRWSTVPTG